MNIIFFSSNFALQLYRGSCTNGVQMEQRPYAIELARPHEIGRQLKRMADEQVEIVFCVIPSRGAMSTDTYAKIKIAAELEANILTQCIKAETIKNGRSIGQTIANIFLKINAKMNGVNHRLSPASAVPIIKDFEKEPVMFFGADVTHPTPGQTRGPSVAAAVASHDRNGFCYNSGWRPQIGEIVADFRTFVKEALVYFRE